MKTKYINSFTNEEFEGIESIGNIIWFKQPEFCIQLANMFGKDKIKIVR